MHATKHTLNGFPAPLSRSNIPLITGLHRFALSAAMYNTFRTPTRPPLIKRLPFQAPLSRANGANPTNAVISPRDKHPNSGSIATSVVAVTTPTPGTLESNALKAW